MPCLVSSDVHEWYNVLSIVPTSRRLKLYPGKWSGDTQWGEKTPWSFTAACRCDFGQVTERSRELRTCGFGHRGAPMEHRLPFLKPLTPYLYGGHRLVGSLAGAAHSRKDIWSNQWSAQAGQKSAEEFKSKSWPDWILICKESWG